MFYRTECVGYSPIREGTSTERNGLATVGLMKAKRTSAKVLRTPMRELLSQRKRGANQPFFLRLSNGQRVRVSDPMSMAITPQTVFVVRRTDAIERIALKEVEGIEDQKNSS